MSQIMSLLNHASLRIPLLAPIDQFKLLIFHSLTLPLPTMP
jgi:hypothetical protein